MATYSTDLTTLTTAESGTWTEFASPYNGGGTPASNIEGYIQGTACYSQTTGKAVGLEISVVFDSTANQTFATDEVLFAWCFYANGVNLETYANSGWRFGIGSSTSAWDWFRVGGSDYGRNPYGGWTNFAIDPTATETGTIGGGNGGNYRYFGSVPYTLNEITKGEPSAADAMRKGRGIISVTGTGGSFAELAQYNDYNAGGTPPGTSSTSVDSGRHRLGLFQEASGTYLWKGLLSLGTTGASVTFSDSNETIIIDDCPHTYADFNLVQINNASSSVTLTNITFISTASTANGVGYFEVAANATVNLTGCSFNSMGNFTFLSNTTCASTFNSCGLVTANGSDLRNSVFNTATTTSTVLWNTDSDTNGKLDGCSFTSDGGNHAIEVTALSTQTSITLTDIAFSGYETYNVSGTSTGNETVYINIGSGTFTIYTSNCTGNVSYRTAGASVSIVADPVTVSVTATNAAGTALNDCTVFLRTAASGALPYDATVTISNSGTTASVTHTAHGMANGDKVYIKGASLSANNGVFTISNVTTNAYDYTMGSTPGSSPTGTIKAYFVYLYGNTGDTSPLNQLSMSRTFSASQSAVGWVRKSTTAPYYKQGTLAGTVSNTVDTPFTAVLTLDQ